MLAPSASSSCPDAENTEPLSAIRRRLDARLAVLLSDPPSGGSRVRAAMRYGTLAPGKRVRPLLMLATARSLGACPDGLLDVACALEMVHAASLFLDDLPCMDDAPSRRGQPTVHAAFGEDVALLSAVALLAQALRTTATAPGVAACARADMVAALSGAVGLDGLVAGQYDDLHGGAAVAESAAIDEVNDRKTGALFAAAFELAAIAAGSGAAVRAAMHAAALELGRAFQLADDLADVEADAASPCKVDGVALGRATGVACLGADQARQKLDGHVREAQRLLALAMPRDTAVVDFTRAMFDRTVRRTLC